MAVTIIREDGSEQTLPFVISDEKRAEYERRLVNALMANETYVNAVRNSDEETAHLTGSAAIRRAVSSSEDVGFQRAFYDKRRVSQQPAQRRTHGGLPRAERSSG